MKWVCAAVLFLAAIEAAAQTPVEIITTALDADQQATASRARLQFRVGNRVSEYTMERRRPDLFHMVASTGGRTEEVYSGGGFMYLHTPQGWQKNPVAKLKPGMASITGLIKNRLVNIKELAPRTGPGGERRVFSGNLSWSQGGGFRDGRLEIEITKSTGLPARLIYEGVCGASPCSFDQKMEYDSTLQIELPTR